MEGYENLGYEYVESVNAKYEIDIEQSMKLVEKKWKDEYCPNCGESNYLDDEGEQIKSHGCYFCGCQFEVGEEND